MTEALQRLGLFDNLPERTSIFLVRSTGDYNAAVLVLGMEGVRSEVREIFMGDASTAPDDMCSGILEALADPQEWVDNGHGQGDGEPFWHIHFSFEDGSLEVQRISSQSKPPPIRRPLPSCPAFARPFLRSTQNRGKPATPHLPDRESLFLRRGRRLGRTFS